MNLKSIFKKKQEKKEEVAFVPPKDEYKWECFACGGGIDPTFHKWTKQNGKHFHRVCWKTAMKKASDKKLI